MVRPFATYRELRAVLTAEAVTSSRARGLWILVRRPLLLLLVIGGFVSFTTSGRFVWVHVVSAMIAWAFAPIYMTFWVLIMSRLAVRNTSRERRAPEIVDLYFAGHGPYFLFFLGIAGVCLFAPEVWPAFRWLLDSGVLFIVFLGTIAWGAIITFAFFRAGLALSMRGTILTTVAFYIFLDGSAVAWFIATGQLLPLLGVATQ